MSPKCQISVGCCPMFNVLVSITQFGHFAIETSTFDSVQQPTDTTQNSELTTQNARAAQPHPGCRDIKGASPWLVILLAQELPYHGVCIFVPAGSGVTELDDAILVEHKVAGPCVAKIVAPDLVRVIDNDRILDAFLGYGFFDFADIFFVIDARRVHTDDDQAILSIF